MTRRGTAPRGTAQRGTARPRVVATLAAAGALAGLALAGLTPVAASAAPSADALPDFRQTKTLVREHLNSDGSTTLVDTREVTVEVDRVSDLYNRERVVVSWTGAHPTGGRTADPFGASGVGQEYPVVILQCRGVENPTAGQEQLSIETCWTTTRNQRAGFQVAARAVWAKDRYAAPAEVAIGGSADPWPAQCPADSAAYRNRLVPFVGADGTEFWNCNLDTIAPEQATDSALPANDLAAATAPDGTGSTPFEVRTDEVNESLGCTDGVDCSLVVIPIMGISCAGEDAECRKEGIWAPGTLRSDTGDGYDATVSATFWWSESNWRNRFVVPLDFAPPPDVCDLLDERAPVNFYGSELLNQATLQWAPAYCLDDSRFKFRHNRSSEALARRQLGTADSVAAFVSEPLASTSTAVAYAPTAVTGWGIGFIADKADNAGEITSLTLTPRLVAKLLTLSYPATPGLRATHCDVSDDDAVEVIRSSEVAARDAARGPLAEGACDVRSRSTRTETVDGAQVEVEYTSITEGRLDLVANPRGITSDPEFIALNPGVPVRGDVAEATLLALSEDSDTMHALTSWIAADDAAMAFLGGEPDENGMRVNGYYEDVALPVGDWPLLDLYVEPSGQTCIVELAGTVPTLNRYAAPVNSLKKTSEALLEAKPTSQVITAGGGPIPCKWESTRQGFGARFMLALTTLADAERYGLAVASLTGADSAVAQAPTQTALAAALPAFTQAGPGQIFEVDQESMAAEAYPGTMVVSTAALLDGLSAADAGSVADFVRIATTEGQVEGRGNGQLPEGYLPIQPSGSTAALYAAAQVSAEAIEQQDPSLLDVEDEDDGGSQPAPSFTSTPSAATRAAATTATPAAGAAAAATVDGLPAAAEPDAVATTSALTQVESTPAGAAVPAMLGMALAGAFGGPLLRALSRRGAA